MNAQFPSPANTSSTLTSGGNEVTVSATASVQVSNATLETKDRLLKNAILDLLTSGPNMLKATPTEQPAVKTKITNQVSNTTQSVEGIEATNAIVGVELTKALKNLVLSTSQPNQTSMVTIITSSTCKPSSVNLISCENTVNLK